MTSPSQLFRPLTLRGLTLKNRIVVSPMCQYSSKDGFADDWHLVHLGSRAVGGAALVITEAAAVSQEGRITADDLGIWKDEHVEMLARIVRFLKAQGAATGIQLAHAGRKASTTSPWTGGKPVLPPEATAWTPVAPSAVPFADGYPMPSKLDFAGIGKLRDDFRRAARRAVRAGFDLIEIHSAHGYLLHSFLSPLSNRRVDEYGGSLENRCRLLVQIAADLRAVIPDTMPLLVRISASDWVEGGWDLAQSVVLAKMLREAGVDLIDCSSGGAVSTANIPVGPLYQVPFAETIRREAGIATGAVGMIREPAEAEGIVAGEKADLILMAREFLREPYWPIRAAKELGEKPLVPPQYGRAFT
jgi:2,4-dienoyl-CoA reductase-like NADH-dependent reductase (Old Yellow Enzyme family)